MKKIEVAKKPIIRPTDKPTPQDMVTVATALVTEAQKALLSPSAVIAALYCAYDLYAENAKASGFDADTADKCRQLGLDIAEAVRKSGIVKTRSVVAARPSGIVGPDGVPLVIETPQEAPQEALSETTQSEDR